MKETDHSFDDFEVDEENNEEDNLNLSTSMINNADPEGDEDNIVEDNSLPPSTRNCLKNYFFKRLQEVLDEMGYEQKIGEEWSVVVIRRTSGITLGSLDVTYCNDGKKFRSRIEVAGALKITPTVKKNIRLLTRDQFYYYTQEFREKMLISQKLNENSLSCEEIKFSDDNISLEPTQQSNSNLYFSLGNTTILNWGIVINNEGFYNQTQIYPLGFTCLRQEHDIKLDCVVDCLCEIDALCEDSDDNVFLYLSEREKYSTYESLLSLKSLIPVFRLSVEWKLPEKKRLIKVYEARSPQQAWQAAMLESVGVDSSPIPFFAPPEGKSLLEEFL